MKRVLSVILILLSILFISCENECDVKEDIKELKTERQKYQIIVREEQKDLDYTRDLLNSTKSELEQVQTELNIYKNGNIPYYVLRLKLKQSHVTLDLGKHMKDEMNAVEFNIVVDKRFYDDINVNDELLKEFRGGSFLTEGSIGNWKITVIDKFIKSGN